MYLCPGIIPNQHFLKLPEKNDEKEIILRIRIQIEVKLTGKNSR